MSRKTNSSNSLTYVAWQRLKKNKLAVFGLFVIAVAVVVAILGSLIRPDSTPMANEMTLQLTTKKPGFEVKMLKVHKNGVKNEVSFFERLFFKVKPAIIRVVSLTCLLPWY